MEKELAKSQYRAKTNEDHGEGGKNLETSIN